MDVLYYPMPTLRPIRQEVGRIRDLLNVETLTMLYRPRKQRQDTSKSRDPGTTTAKTQGPVYHSASRTDPDRASIKTIEQS